MASMSIAGAKLAGATLVPASGLITGGLHSSMGSCPASSTIVLMGQNNGRTAAVSTRPSSVVARASALEQSSQAWNVVKNAAAAAAISLVLSASPAVQAKESNVFPSLPDNGAGQAARDILQGAKKQAEDAFSQAQKTGAETVGQSASADRKTAPPAISQLDPTKDEAPDVIGDTIAAKADEAAEKAPGTDQQKGKGFVNPIEKVFSTPQRGLGEGGLPKNGLP